MIGANDRDETMPSLTNRECVERRVSERGNVGDRQQFTWDDRELERTKRRYARSLWKQLDANPDLTHAERRSVMLTGSRSEEAREAEEEVWQKQSEENRHREHEREQRASLERQLLGQARRAGFHLVHVDDGLKWKRARPQGSVRRRGASRERRPQARRIARTCGSRGDPHKPDDDDPDLSAAPERDAA